MYDRRWAARRAGQLKSLGTARECTLDALEVLGELAGAARGGSRRNRGGGFGRGVGVSIVVEAVIIV